MVHVLNIVVIVQKIKRTIEELDVLLIRELYFGLRKLRNLCRHHRDAFRLECIANGVEGIGIGENFEGILIVRKVLSACIKRKHHKVVGIHVALFSVDDDLSFFIEHERYASGSSDAAVSFRERAADVGRGTVLVIGKCLNDDGNAS